MVGAKFDILFAGELLRDADPEAVRRQLQQRFTLSDEAVDKLFSGRTVTIKRDVDTATATRYREIFREAKALVQIRPVEAKAQSTPVSPTESVTGSPVRGQAEGSTESEPKGLHLVGGTKEPKPLEQPGTGDRPEIDTSHLRMISGQDWSLEDCQPPPASTEVPDTSHLKLITPAPDSGEERED